VVQLHECDKTLRDNLKEECFMDLTPHSTAESPLPQSELTFTEMPLPHKRCELPDLPLDLHWRIESVCKTIEPVVESARRHLKDARAGRSGPVEGSQSSVEPGNESELHNGAVPYEAEACARMALRRLFMVV
jgi:hypothetical protein